MMIMDNLNLIDEIDRSLGETVEATRRAHLQIQNVLDKFRQRVKFDNDRDTKKQQEE